MESLLPYDIARLVYGYLDEEGCSTAAKDFIETSQYMKGCLAHIAKGRKIMTKFNGLSLVELLDLLTEITCYVRSLECACMECGDIFRHLRFLLKLSPAEENARKPGDVRAETPQTTSKRSPRKRTPLETNSTPKSSKSPSETADAPSSEIQHKANAREFMQLVLENTAFHEKLAENINKVKAIEGESHEKILQKKIVENVADKSELDQIFNEMLEELGEISVAKKDEGHTSCPDGEDHVVTTSEESTQHRNDDLASSISTPGSRLAEDLEQQTPWRKSIMQTPNVVEQGSQLESSPNIAGQITQMTSSAGVPTPYAGNIVEQALDKSLVSPPVGIQPRPFAPQQPGMVPLSVRTVMATSTRCISVTTQGSPAYVIASSPTVTPVVIGTSCGGTAVRFTPAGPSVPQVRYPPPTPTPKRSTIKVLASNAQGRSVPQVRYPPPMRSTIKFLAGSSQTSSLPPVLPKPQTQTFPGMLGQPIFQVPVSHQGNSAPNISSLQNCVATVSLTPSASPVIPTTVVKMGARTRGGKVKSYPGRKKIVQTIGPSATVSPDEPKSSRNVVCEGKTDVVDTAKDSELPAGKLTEELVGNASTDALKSNDVRVNSSANDEAEMPIAEPIADLADSVVETVKPDADVAKHDVEVTKSDSDATKSDDNVTKSDEVLSTVPNQQSCSQERINPSIPQSEVGGGSSSSNAVPCRTDATPQQGSEPRVKLRKRLSLSTPRRGSHIRTLEFKTPPKNPKVPRKSLSSPKNKAPETRRPEMQKMLESIKKSELFKSPPKKEKRSWDADLRQYTTEEDIPTSVGLKRKYSTPNKTGIVSKSKGSNSTTKCAPGDSKSDEGTPKAVENMAKGTEASPEKGETKPKTPERKHETDEDLVNRIQRDVLAVIDEEDIAELASTSLCGNKSGDSGESPKSSPKLVKSPIQSPGTSSVLEIGDIGLPASTIKKLYQRTTSVDDNSCTMDSPLSKAPKDTFSSPKRSQNEASKDNLFTSPKKSLVESPEKDCDSKLQLTPSPQPLKKDLELSLSPDLRSTPQPKVRMFSELTRSPGSGSLEGALIRECRRIENMEMERVAKNSGKKSSDCASPKVLNESDANCSVGVTSSGVNSFISLHHFLPPSGITPLKTPRKTPGKRSDPFGITPLKTPWKPPSTAPVEMTPISKIINEETRLGKCILLTPTIPPTPDYEELKNQEQPAGNADCSPSANQKTPQSKTPTSSAAPVKTPSPKKLPKALSKTPSKTPVVKLKEITGESAVKSRKKKPARVSKITDTDQMVDKCFESFKEAMYPSDSSKKKPQDATSEPDNEEVPQKKKTLRKRKVPQKSEVQPKKEPKTKPKKEPKKKAVKEPQIKPKKEPKAKPKKESKTHPKKEPKTEMKSTKTFLEVIESFENSTVIFSSSSDDDSELTNSKPQFNAPKIPMKQCTLTNILGYPTQRKDAKKSPKKKATKRKKVAKDMDSKPKSENVSRKKAKEDYTGVTSENDAAGKKGSDKRTLDEESEASPPDLLETATAQMKNLVVLALDAGVSKDLASGTETEDKQRKVSTPLTYLENSQNVCRVINTSAVRESSNVDSPSSPTPEMGSSSALKEPTERTILPDFVIVAGDEVGEEEQAKFWFSPFLSLFEYCPPPSPSPNKSESPLKLSDNCSTKVEEVMKRRLETLSSSEEDEQSQMLVKSMNDRTDKVEAVEGSTKKRGRRSKSSSTCEDDEPSQKPLNLTNYRTDKVENVERSTKRRERSRSSCSSQDDDSPRKPPWRPAKYLNDRNDKVEKVMENRIRRPRRCRISSSSSEEDKSPRKPRSSAKLSNDSNELIVGHRKRGSARPRSSSSSSEDGVFQQKPRRHAKLSNDSNELIVGRRKRRSARPRSSSSSSEDGEFPQKPRRPSKSYDSSNKEDLAKSRKRRRRRSRSGSSSVSEEDGSSRKRRRTGELRNHTLLRNERRPREKSRDRRDKGRGYPPSPHKRSHSRRSRHSSSEGEKGRQKPHNKPLPYSRSRDRGRAWPRSRSPNKRLYESTRRDRSKHSSQELKDSSRRSNRERYESRSPSLEDEDHQTQKRLDDSTRRGRSRNRYHRQTKDEDGRRRSDRERANSRSWSRGDKDHQPKTRLDDSRRDRSKHRSQELLKDKHSSRRPDRKETMQKPTSCHQGKRSSIEEPKRDDEDRRLKKHHDESKEYQDDPKKHRDSSSRWRTRFQPTKDKDSSRGSDAKDKMQKPTSNLQDRQSSIKEPSSTERWTETSRINPNEPSPKPSRTTLDELEEGEISEESRNTIFQFSKNNPHATGGTVDRLSSPVASESRQKLLKNVNVDKFLSLVHGDAKSPLAKKEEPTNLPNR